MNMVKVVAERDNQGRFTGPWSVLLDETDEVAKISKDLAERTGKRLSRKETKSVATQISGLSPELKG